MPSETLDRAATPREFIERCVASLNDNYAALRAIEDSRDDNDTAVYYRCRDKMASTFETLERLDVSVNYSITAGYWVDERTLSQFKTEQRLAAEATIAAINDAVEKQKRARTDEAKAKHADVINTGLAFLQQRQVEYSRDNWTGRYELPRTEAEVQQTKSELHHYYTKSVALDIERRRREVRDRIDYEMRILQSLQERVEAGEWDNIWASELKGSNRDDLIKAIDEQKLMNDLLNKLA